MDIERRWFTSSGDQQCSSFDRGVILSVRITRQSNPGYTETDGGCGLQETPAIQRRCGVGTCRS